MTTHKFTDFEINLIRTDTRSPSLIAKEWGCSRQLIWKIQTKRAYAHVQSWQGIPLTGVGVAVPALAVAKSEDRFDIVRATLKALISRAKAFNGDTGPWIVRFLEDELFDLYESHFDQQG